MIMDNNDRITELETELAALKAELEKAREKEKSSRERSQATLFMLEDIEKSRDEIGRAKREWEQTFDAISDPLFIHDKEFKVVKANLAYKNAAGMEFKELMGRPYYEVFPKMDGPFQMCLKAQELQEEEEEEEEEEEYSCPLTNRIFKIRFYPIKDVNGSYLYSVHILEDITEAKKAEEKIKQEMETTTHLLMIAEATAKTTDIDKMMEQVVHCGHEIMKCDLCLSYLWDKESKVFKPCREFGLAGGAAAFFRAEAVGREMEVVRKAMEGKRPIVEYVGAALRGRPKQGNHIGLPLQCLAGMNIAALAVIPLIGRKEALGLIIGIYSKPTLTLHPLPEGEGKAKIPSPLGGEGKTPAPSRGGMGRGWGKGGFEFTDRNMKVMEGIMHQVSIAIEEARLYRDSIDRAMELSSRMETIKAMNEIDKAILSTLDRDEILESAITMVSRVVPCERATVVTVDRERGGFVYAAGFGVTFVPKGTFVPFSDTSARDMIETGRPEYVSNLAEIEDILPLDRKFFEDGFLSHVRVPLTIKGEVTGILTVGAKRPSAFSTENLSTLEKLAAQIGVALSNARLISDLEELFLGTVKSLSSAIDAKSPWTAGHSERVTKYALEIGKEMGLSEKELKDLELAGLLHDVGKIGTYEAILDKPAKLTEEEQAMMRQHPAKGAEILAPIKQLKDIIPAIRYHQEYYDGTGYPEGIKGEAIPLFARIIGVADTVDAMGADRPYRKGRAMDVIVAEIKRCSGTQFDPKVVEAFLRVV